MCVVFCWIWVYVCIYSQRSKGAKCLQTLHNVYLLVWVYVCLDHCWVFGALVSFFPFTLIIANCFGILILFLFFCTRLWLSQIFFPVCNYKRFPRTQKSHNVYFWGSIRSYFFPPFNAFHDWLYLTECLCGLLNWIAGFMVSMAMLHCHKCSWVVNALFGHIHNFFYLYHLNRDKSN